MNDNNSSSLWNQLGNVVALTSKQDQIAWTIFGIFWAAEAILLGSLFTAGNLPQRPIGMVISFTGIFLSMVWFVIQRRAVNLLTYYEEVIKILECEYLKIPSRAAISPSLNKVLFEKAMKGALVDKVLDKLLYIFGRVRRIRRLMSACAFVAILIWAFSFWLFLNKL